MNHSKYYKKYLESCEGKPYNPVPKKLFTSIFYSILDIIKSEQEVIDRTNEMCEESLSPELFEKWEEILFELKLNRKKLK